MTPPITTPSRAQQFKETVAPYIPTAAGLAAGLPAAKAAFEALLGHVLPMQVCSANPFLCKNHILSLIPTVVEKHPYTVAGITALLAFECACLAYMKYPRAQTPEKLPAVGASLPAPIQLQQQPAIETVNERSSLDPDEVLEVETVNERSSLDPGEAEEIEHIIKTTRMLPSCIEQVQAVPNRPADPEVSVSQAPDKDTPKDSIPEYKKRLRPRNGHKIDYTQTKMIKV